MDWREISEEVDESQAPFNGDMVIVGNDRWAKPGYWADDNFHPWLLWDRENWEPQGWTKDAVTHWMPMPAPLTANQRTK